MEVIVDVPESFSDAECMYEKTGAVFKFGCDLQGRKINFTNSKTLVGRCRDRP